MIEELHLGTELLRHFGHNEQTIEDYLPSWVPRWDIQEACTFPPAVRASFLASSRFQSTPFEVMLDTEDASLGLKIKAVLLDTVLFWCRLPTPRYFAIIPSSDVELAWSLEPGFSNPVEEMCDSLDEIRPSLPNPHYHDAQSLAATFTAGVTLNRGIAPDGAETAMTRNQNLQDFCAYRRAKAMNIPKSKVVADDMTRKSAPQGDPNRYLRNL
ncbi:hypothetical protein EJ02DRAFT_462230 [Clathrospora elynae]|uniref:Uncharacterized protein n=1 Tax=Clathrospora elynae TaxID=706981 RepID=A0A6A5TDG1_9PLEO|nr:hypothetical protein EJ02DRAFT_462230 [Clathrospora elynae]